MSEHDESYRDLPDSCSGVYPPEEFEGLWIEHWPNGQLKFRGQYEKRHMRVGQHITFWENGVLQEVSFWVEGYAIGTILWFRDDGSKEVERDFGADGGRTRSWTEKWYDYDIELYKVAVWRNGEKTSHWLRPDIREFFDEIGLDESIKEVVKEFYPEEE